MEGGPVFPRGGSGRAAPGTQGTKVGPAVGAGAGPFRSLPASFRWTSTRGSFSPCPMDEEGRAGAYRAPTVEHRGEGILAFKCAGANQPMGSPRGSEKVGEGSLGWV